MPLAIVIGLAALATGFAFYEGSQAANSTSNLAGSLTTLAIVGAVAYVAVKHA